MDPHPHLFGRDVAADRQSESGYVIADRGRGVGRLIAFAVIALAVPAVPAVPSQAAEPGPYQGSRGPSPRGYPDRSTDADALARIAPPSSRATLNQDYGDAAFARARGYRRGYPGYGYDEARGAGYESTPERPLGLRPGFTYGPAYLSAPQIFGGSPSEQTPLLPFLGE